MHKFIALLAILALPAMALGVSSYSILHAGSSSVASRNPNPDLTLDVILDLGPEAAGTFGFFGALQGSGLAATLPITARAYQPPISNNPSLWTQGHNPEPLYVGQPLSSLLDFGAIEAGGSGAELPIGPNNVVTLTIGNVNTLPIGSYDFRVVGSLDYGAGASWMSGGNPDPVYVDASIPFVLNITPEPATLSLLALGGLLVMAKKKVSGTFTMPDE